MPWIFWIHSPDLSPVSIFTLSTYSMPLCLLSSFSLIFWHHKVSGFKTSKLESHISWCLVVCHCFLYYSVYFCLRAGYHTICEFIFVKKENGLKTEIMDTLYSGGLSSKLNMILGLGSHSKNILSLGVRALGLRLAFFVTRHTFFCPIHGWPGLHRTVHTVAVKLY